MARHACRDEQRDSLPAAQVYTHLPTSSTSKHKHSTQNLAQVPAAPEEAAKQPCPRRAACWSRAKPTGAPHPLPTFKRAQPHPTPPHPGVAPARSANQPLTMKQAVTK